MAPSVGRVELPNRPELFPFARSLANGLLHGPLGAQHFVGFRVPHRFFVRIVPHLFFVINSTINSS